jgi:hypothetical protein
MTGVYKTPSSLDMKKNRQLVADIEAFYMEWVQPLIKKPRRVLQVLSAIASSVDGMQSVATNEAAGSSAVVRAGKAKCIPSSDPDY